MEQAKPYPLVNDYRHVVINAIIVHSTKLTRHGFKDCLDLSDTEAS